MFLGKVTGTVVMTVKHEAFAGQTLLSVSFLDEHGEPTGQDVLAIDRAQAGVGDTVLVMREGNGVRQIFGRDQGLNVDQAIVEAVPVRSVIVGIVDEVDAPPAAAWS